MNALELWDLLVSEAESSHKTMFEKDSFTFNINDFTSETTRQRFFKAAELSGNSNQKGLLNIMVLYNSSYYDYLERLSHERAA